MNLGGVQGPCAFRPSLYLCDCNISVKFSMVSSPCFGDGLGNAEMTGYFPFCALLFCP